MNITLVRHAYLPEATLGRLHVGDIAIATLEEPWSPDPDGPGGQRREPGMYESCVPDGTYELVPHNGTRYSNVWCLVNPALGVYRWPTYIPPGQKWGRATILIHNGNTLDHTEGCVLVGLSHAANLRVADSRAALTTLGLALGAGSHRLVIRPTMGTQEIRK